MTMVYRDSAFSAWLKVQTAGPGVAALSTFGTADVLCQLTQPPAGVFDQELAAVRLEDLTRMGNTRYFATVRRARLTLNGLVDDTEFGMLACGMFGRDLLPSASNHQWIPGLIAGPKMLGKTHVQPLLSAQWTFGELDNAASPGGAWKAYQMYDGRVTSLTLNPVENGPCTYSATLEGNLYIQSGALGSYVLTVAAAHPGFVPTGNVFERAGVTFTRHDGTAQRTIYPVLTGSNLTFTNVATEVVGTLATAATGGVDPARRTAGDVTGTADILYQSRTDQDNPYSGAWVANQSIADYLNLARNNWVLSFAYPGSTATSLLSFKMPRTVYNTGTQIETQNEYAVQHLVGGMEKENTGQTNDPLFCQIDLLNATAASYVGALA